MKYVYFTSKSFQQLINNCHHFLASDEPGTIISFPKSGLRWRVEQILQDYSSEFKMPITKMQFNSSIFDSKEEVREYMYSNLPGKNKPVGIFITQLESLIHDGNYHVIQWIGEIRRENLNLNLIYCFETDFTNPEIAKYISDMSIFSNITYYPLYDSEEIKNFAQYTCEKWKMKCKKQEIDEICVQYGGNIWLVKEAVRTLKQPKNQKVSDIIHTDTMQFKLEQIYLSLRESEKTLLMKIVSHSKAVLSETEIHSLKYLTNVGVIKNNKLTIPALSSYITKILPKFEIKIEGLEILINGVIINAGFSRKQLRLLRYFLNNKGKIVSREEVAKLIWPSSTTEYYSDWAIDRIILRLRENLSDMGINKDIIKTVRGKGFSIELKNIS